MDSLSWVDDEADLVEGTKAEAVATEAATRRAENFIAKRLRGMEICAIGSDRELIFWVVTIWLESVD